MVVHFDHLGQVGSIKFLDQGQGHFDEMSLWIVGQKMLLLWPTYGINIVTRSS